MQAAKAPGDPWVPGPQPHRRGQQLPITPLFLARVRVRASATVFQGLASSPTQSPTPHPVTLAPSPTLQWETRAYNLPGQLWGSTCISMQLPYTTLGNFFHLWTQHPLIRNKEPLHFRVTVLKELTDVNCSWPRAGHRVGTPPVCPDDPSKAKTSRVQKHSKRHQNATRFCLWTGRVSDQK